MPRDDRPVRHCGKWERTALGIEAPVKLQTENVDVRVVVAMPDQVWALLSFIESEWPEIAVKWRDVREHPDKYDTVSTMLGAPPTLRQWSVPSNSDRTKRYQVTLRGGRFTCECDGFGYRGMCSHIKAVDQLLAKEHAGESRQDRDENDAAGTDPSEPEQPAVGSG